MLSLTCLPTTKSPKGSPATVCHAVAVATWRRLHWQLGHGTLEAVTGARLSCSGNACLSSSAAWTITDSQVETQNLGGPSYATVSDGSRYATLP